jgi:HEAT repeat protein
MEIVCSLIEELSSGDDERSEAAAIRMATLPAGQRQAAFKALSDLLKEGDEDGRWWAARALAELPVDGAVDLLIAALGDRACPVQQCAALGLRLHPDPSAVPPLIAALESEDSLLASLVADALIAIGSPAVPALLAVLQKGSQSARLEAVRTLAHIGDERAIPELFASLDEDSALMEYWASEGLERMGVGMLFYSP